ncbi:MAG: hypothetical protein BRD55_00845 [Bacteroidetes bacterium SW_9_63_38]|nr:MAG: hypothetical protein BRD55_00845 [Bacteroidetes bacterium SW_9_63_38]
MTPFETGPALTVLLHGDRCTTTGVRRPVYDDRDPDLHLSALLWWAVPGSRVRTARTQNEAKCLLTRHRNGTLHDD